MNADLLRAKVGEGAWQSISARLKSAETREVLHDVFECILERLSSRIEDIRVDEERNAICFFTEGREFLTINVTRRDMRIYIHPAAGAFFDPDAEFEVERFSLWKASLQKKSGKHRGMSAWISDKKYLPGVKNLIDSIPASSGQAWSGSMAEPD